MAKIVTAQIEDELAEDLEEYVRKTGLTKSSAAKLLLEKGIQSWKLENAIAQYANKKISLMKAAELADLSIWEFIEELDKRGTPINISFKTIREALGE